MKAAPPKSQTLSAKLGGQEGISRDKYAATRTLIDILTLLVEKIPGFWQKYALRGGFALYHTVHSQQHLASQSEIGNVLRWTADMDLEALTELTDGDCAAITSVLLEAGYSLPETRRGKASHGQYFEILILNADGVEVEIDILDCHRASSLLNEQRESAIIDTEIHWDDNRHIPVRTQSIEEIVARKLLIHYYHGFRPQDALDLFYALSFIELDRNKLRCAFLASLALWASEDDIKGLCQYGQKPDILIDWLVQMTHEGLIDRILQRVTLYGLEVLFDNRYHIVDNCEKIIKQRLHELLSFSTDEAHFLMNMLYFRRQLLQVRHYTKRGKALPPSLWINLSCEKEGFISLMQRLHPDAHDDGILAYDRDLHSSIMHKAEHIVHTLQQHDSAYAYLNYAYVGRCLELYMQSGGE